MHAAFASAGKNQAIPIWFVHAANFDAVRKKLGPSEQAFIAAAAFEAKPGRSLLLPGGNGRLSGVLFGIEGPDDAEIDRFRPGQRPSSAIPSRSKNFLPTVRAVVLKRSTAYAS